MLISRKVVGVEKDRLLFKSKAKEIVRLILSKPVANLSNTRKGIMAPPILSDFKNLDPIYLDDDFWLFPSEDYTPEVLWPLDVGVITQTDPLTFLYVKTINPKDVRGTANKFSPYMVSRIQSQFMNNKLFSCKSTEVWLGGKWVCAEQRTFWENARCAESAIPTKWNAPVSETSGGVGCAAGVALRHRYEWAISIKFGKNSPSIRLATDVKGIKNIFKFREISKNANRRDSLINWVTDHWRQNRNEPDIENYVRNHLRGNTSFEWEGLKIEILPSQFDIEKRDKLIIERQAMKITGCDKRIKQ